ncbi:MAG: hypothetical protein JWO71_1999 [Candidatus Acidoferrum typicum]|nr:hypothetical protein [Candidatus Acidoferrum typicum]
MVAGRIKWRRVAAEGLEVVSSGLQPRKSANLGTTNAADSSHIRAIFLRGDLPRSSSERYL